MDDSYEQTGVTGVDSQVDSDSTQFGVDTTTDTTGGSDSTGQQGSLDLTALQTENARLKGQISALQKKYNERLSQGGRVSAQADSTDDEGDESERTYDSYMKDLKYGLMDRLPLYDGSDPEFEGQPALDKAEIARIKENPLALLTMDELKQYLKTGNVEWALSAMEQRLADMVESKQATPSVGKMGTNVNPSPAQTPEQGDNVISDDDLWGMPLEDLEGLTNSARKHMGNRK